MTLINPVLRNLALQQILQPREKRAFQPAAAIAGAPPTDPAASGAAPPMDPSMGMGMAPPMPGMAPPMDPSMGMAPPMPGMAPPPMPGAPPMDPAMAAGGGMAAPMPMQKPKPEQWMQALDYRLYNMQQQLTALLNSLNVAVPAGALITPPGMPAAPTMESAMPGGTQDPSQKGPKQQSAIGAIEPMQGASPELAQEKTSAVAAVEEFRREAEANCPAGYRIVLLKAAEAAPVVTKTAMEQFADQVVASPDVVLADAGPLDVSDHVAAVKAMLQAR